MNAAEAAVGLVEFVIGATFLVRPRSFYWLDRQTNGRGAEMWARLGYKKALERQASKVRVESLRWIVTVGLLLLGPLTFLQGIGVIS